jgi:NAD(P)-dependent dehydrogenase (short-subunit alcohol dehydrogenase family)
MRNRLWRSLKRWRRLSFGAVSVLFRLDRSVRVTNGHRRPAPERAVGRAADSGAMSATSAGALRPLAVIVGVGPGFGFALADCLAREGFDLVLVARNAERLSPLVEALHANGATVESLGIDATSESAVAKLFQHIRSEHGIPTLTVYSLQYSGPGTAIEIEPAALEASWRHNCFGAFLVGRSAARLMLERGSGTLVFVGSTSSLIGRAEHLNLAIGKFGQRALAQVMARELWPKGVHVAHVVIDADIAEGEPVATPQADPSHLAAGILALHNQPRTAWTSELDLRPWNEVFWEHC